MRKNITIKVFSLAGKFKAIWDNATFQSFEKEINSGLGACSLILGEKFDYQGDDCKIGNHIEILISDGDTLNLIEGYRLIYSGYISKISPAIENDEKIQVDILGHYTQLGVDLLKSGAYTTLFTDSTAGLTTTGPGDAADLGLVMRAIIERYRAETLNPVINYSLGSIPLTATTALYTLECKTYREALDKIMSMAPEGYYFYFDEYNILKFGAKPTTPTHEFIFGKHFQNVRIDRSLEKIRNVLLIWNGETGAGKVYKEYKDDASILQYGRRAYILKDYGIDDEDGADKIGAKFIAENKDPDVKVACTIIDNNIDSAKGYDIESIQPGDTCVFKGFNEQFADIFRDNMLITKVVYYLDKVELIIEPKKSSLVEWQNKTNRDLNDFSSFGMPTDYT